MSTRSSHATLALVGRTNISPGPASWFRRAARVAAAWHERAQQRRQLRMLDERMLSRADVDAEVTKPFWLP